MIQTLGRAARVSEAKNSLCVSLYIHTHTQLSASAKGVAACVPDTAQPGCQTVFLMTQTLEFSFNTSKSPKWTIFLSLANKMQIG